jgi:hypothetical protein
VLKAADEKAEVVPCPYLVDSSGKPEVGGEGVGSRTVSCAESVAKEGFRSPGSRMSWVFVDGMTAWRVRMDDKLEEE